MGPLPAAGRGRWLRQQLQPVVHAAGPVADADRYRKRWQIELFFRWL